MGWWGDGLVGRWAGGDRGEGWRKPKLNTILFYRRRRL